MDDIVFYNGELMPRSVVRISPDDRGWLLGDGVYEAASSYNGAWFRLAAHWDRLRSSLAKVRIEGADVVSLTGIADELLRRNALDRAPRALLYVQVSRGAAPRTHAFPVPAVRPTVYAYVKPFELKCPPGTGAAVITRPDDRWSRCDIKVISLVANCLANQAAREAGVYEAVFVRDGRVLEGSHTNFFVVQDGVVRTAPLDTYILPGITRAVVLELCRDAGIPVREEALAENDIGRIDEAFLTGTTTEVTPVVTIDGRPVGTGVPGPVTGRIGELFLGLVGAAGAGRPSEGPALRAVAS